MKEKQASVSFLLGAGFSKPKGYPIAEEMNSALMGCNVDKMGFHTDGTLVFNSDKSPIKRNYLNSYDREFYFCKELMKFYSEEVKTFNYEEFYDFVMTKAAEDERVKDIARPYMNGYGSVKQLLAGLENVYSQLIDYYLVDSNEKRWYDDDENSNFEISYQGYTGILNCLTHLCQKYILNVHTLNHDLFFESLNSYDDLSNKICDGFQELGSPYYGKLQSNGRNYMVRLQRYNQQYDKNIRLYKLHGSRDYLPYFTDRNGIGRPDSYIKIRYGISTSDLYKDKVSLNQPHQYEHCFVNYHGDIMIGTTTKILRYNEPLIYKKLFRFFKRNLAEADKLIIIGYGAGDIGINKLIKNNFAYKNKMVYIIDPYPGKNLLKLKEELNGQLVQKKLNDVLIQDISSDE